MRDLTGRGQYIDQAHTESSIQFLGSSLVELQTGGARLSRRGNKEDYVVPNNAYRCSGADRWIAITVASEAQWQALCRVLQLEEFATDIRCSSVSGRKAIEDKLDSAIASATRQHEAFELQDRLQGAGVPAGVVLTPGDVLADSQLAHRGFFKRIDHPEIGSHAVLSQSFSLSGVDAGPRGPAPLLGQHTYEVCSELLNLPSDEISALASAGVFD